MRIILAQINPTVGDLDANQERIIKAIHEAKHMSCEIVLFPELALCGYPPEDLLHLPAFIKKGEKCLEEIIKETKGITAIVGVVRQNKNQFGKPLFNSAAIISDGKLIGFHDKILLPTYDVFDERRYFEPGSEIKIWEINNKRLGITICEDIWQHTELKKIYSDSRYHESPVDQLKKLKPDLILNLSSSPFCTTHFKNRIAVCSSAAIETSAPLLYCNQIGANDSLIFDGYSLFLKKMGNLWTWQKVLKKICLLLTCHQN